jgi:hypothetical protein
MAMTTTSKGKLLATVFALVAIGLIVGSMVRGHPIDKRDLGDLYGCYVVDNQQLFRLTPDAVVTPTRSVPFTARQGRRYAYLDPASPMRVVHRGGALSFEPGPEPAVTIEVYRGSPRALLLQSDVGPPLKAIRTECRP